MPTSRGAVPRDLPLPPQAAGIVIRRAVEHTHELDACSLSIPSGDTVDVVCVQEVRDWLLGLAARTEAGEPL
jgi:hypothetical protein